MTLNLDDTEVAEPTTQQQSPVMEVEEREAVRLEYTPGQAAAAKKRRRQDLVIDFLWDNLGYVRLVLLIVALAWIAAIPHPRLWKGIFVDEHALIPAGQRSYYDWGNVHKADNYLAQLEALQARNASWDERRDYLMREFRAAGADAYNTTHSVYGRIVPPRSEGTEAILLTANWVSRDGGPNLRGVASLLSLVDFFRGQNHWAFEIVPVVGEGYLEGLEDFLKNYKLRANVWNALNLDYPGHSFERLGFFYEGVNGRLPNLDVLSTVSTVARWKGGCPVTLHDAPAHPARIYTNGLKHMWRHFSYAALGRPSAAGGILARHRIDALTLYGPPAQGPHGFHTLGQVVESTFRSFNTLLERLHASFFFYLLPHPENFIPVGHYLPAAVLLGASITLGGFVCPDPIAGAFWALVPWALGALGWLFQTPYVALAAPLLPRPKGAARRSFNSLAHLAYGAMVPTLAMVNFPQAILLGLLSVVALAPVSRFIKIALVPVAIGALAGLKAAGIDLRAEWELFGNVAWPALFAVIIPLIAVSVMI